MDTDQTPTGGQSAATADKVEENSGVDFPGDCLEPFIGSSLVFGDLNLLESVIIVELASPKFAYKYENQGQV